MAILGDTRADTPDALLAMREASCAHFVRSRGFTSADRRNPAKTQFTLACQNAAGVIQEIMGRPSRSVAALHILCNSWPTKYPITRVDFDGFTFNSVLLRVLWHLKDGRPLRPTLMPVLDRPVIGTRRAFRPSLSHTALPQ